jgi:hypothetical protein
LKHIGRCHRDAIPFAARAAAYGLQHETVHS